MKLTIEDNPEAIKRYRHIKPTPGRGTVPCSAFCPGTVRTCSLKRGHPGPHVAHGMFKRVVAVWDKAYEIPKPVRRPKRALKRSAQHPSGRGGMVSTLRRLWKMIARKEHALEEMVFIVFALAMVGFAIQWLILIFR